MGNTSWRSGVRTGLHPFFARFLRLFSTRCCEAKILLFVSTPPPQPPVLPLALFSSGFSLAFGKNQKRNTPQNSQVSEVIPPFLAFLPFSPGNVWSEEVDQPLTCWARSSCREAPSQATDLWCGFPGFTRYSSLRRSTCKAFCCPLAEFRARVVLVFCIFSVPGSPQSPFFPPHGRSPLVAKFRLV